MLHPWAPESHPFYHPGFRDVVATLMCVKQLQNGRMPKVLPELMTTITSVSLIPLIKIKGIRSAIMDQSIVTRTTVVIHTETQTTTTSRLLVLPALYQQSPGSW